MSTTDARNQIQQLFASMASRPFSESARGLLTALGYASDRRIEITPNTASGFASQFGALNPDKALTAEWRSVNFLFQLTDEEIGNRLAFAGGEVDNAIIESYVFLAIHLTGAQYTRTRLSSALREINRLSAMPAINLFRHGESISLAIIDRELNKKAPE